MKRSDGKDLRRFGGLWWWLYTPALEKNKVVKNVKVPATLKSDYVKPVRACFQIPSFSLVFVSSFFRLWIVTVERRSIDHVMIKRRLVKMLLGHEQHVNHMGPIARSYLVIVIWFYLCAIRRYRIIEVEF